MPEPQQVLEWMERSAESRERVMSAVLQIASLNARAYSRRSKDSETPDATKTRRPNGSIDETEP